jgi:hypothetical protein
MGLIARLHAPKPLTFVGLAPARLMDSRADGVTVDGSFQRFGVLVGGTTTEMTVAGRGGVSPSATTVSLNVTVTEPVAAGYLTIYPCGDQRPNASNLNFTAGQTVPNAVLSKLSDNGKICIFTQTSTHVVIDVNGYNT